MVAAFVSMPPRRLGRHEFLRLRPQRPLRVVAHRGVLWVTLDGEPQDLVVEAGSSVAIAPGARALVTPLGDEAVASTEETGAAPGWSEALADWWSRTVRRAVTP